MFSPPGSASAGKEKRTPTAVAAKNNADSRSACACSMILRWVKKKGPNEGRRRSIRVLKIRMLSSRSAGGSPGPSPIKRGHPRPPQTSSTGRCSKR